MSNLHLPFKTKCKKGNVPLNVYSLHVPLLSAFRIIRGLEGDSRKILDITCCTEREPKLLFKMHCPTLAVVSSLCEQLAENQGQVAKQLVRALEHIAVFDLVTITLKESELPEPVAELHKFRLNISRKTSGSKVRFKN